MLEGNTDQVAQPINESALSIERRRVSFDLTDVPRHFLPGKVLLSRFLDAMSLGFPEGEKLFIHAVVAYQDKIEDPALRESVRAFAFQEIQHGRAHTAYNALLGRHGVRTERVRGYVEGFLARQKKWMPDKALLAWTVAAEHFTATLAESVLCDNLELLAQAQPVLRGMYVWHGIEEIEHRDVAWRVYHEAAGGGYMLRVAGMTFLLFGTLTTMVGGATLMMLQDDEALTDSRTWLEGVSSLFGRKGLLRVVAPRFLRFFDRRFHPSEDDIPELVHTWREAYARSGDPLLASLAVAQPEAAV